MTFTRFLYTLSNDELMELHDLAFRRNAIKSGAVYSNKRAGYKSDVQLHHEAVCSEYAAAQILGLEMNRTVSLRGNKSKIDMVGPCGVTFAVQYRAKRGWDFAMTAGDVKTFTADYGILMWPGIAEMRADDPSIPSRFNDPPDTYEMVGWCSPLGFKYKHTVVDYGYGERWVLPTDRMVGVGALLESVRKYREIASWMGGQRAGVYL